ncbi:MAG: type III glutamate--ammonia ligase, partial [Oxalobacteraceae bacterium]|nr:type III glutamate--ammonia ligase [Oxalobacteraceae bacterium]
KPCYDYKGLSRSRAFLEKLAESMRAVGIDVYQIDHEDANGQFEINYTYADALTSCDHYTFFKMGAAEIAAEMGLICSFMPKPFSNRPGNGLHMHMSIGNGKKNLFEDKSDKRGLDLSTMAYHFAGGLLAHASALAAVCCPTVNSYKRLVVGRSLTGATWAPAYICYGNNNRSGMIRGPGGDGIERKLDPGEPVTESLYEMSPAQLRKQGIRMLPQNLKEALDAFEKDDVVQGALGPLAPDFLELKRMEWVEYMRHVSDWEVDQYLQFF